MRVILCGIQCGEAVGCYSHYPHRMSVVSSGVLPPEFTYNVRLARENPHSRYELVSIGDPEGYDMAILPFAEELVQANPRPQYVQHLSDIRYKQYFKGTTDCRIEVEAETYGDIPYGCGLIIGDIVVVYENGEQTNTQYAIVNIREYPDFQIFVLGLVGTEIASATD